MKEFKNFPRNQPEGGQGERAQKIWQALDDGEWFKIVFRLNCVNQWQKNWVKNLKLFTALVRALRETLNFKPF